MLKVLPFVCGEWQFICFILAAEVLWTSESLTTPLGNICAVISFLSLVTRIASSAQDKSMLHQYNNISCFVLYSFSNNSSQSICPLGSCWTSSCFQEKKKYKITPRCYSQVVEADNFLCVGKTICLRIVFCVYHWPTTPSTRKLENT